MADKEGRAQKACLNSRRRDFSSGRLPRGRKADVVGHLFGQEYHAYLSDAIASATKAINVAMFHVALGGTTYPTRKLVDALAGRAKRGVKVRDRE